MSNWMTVVPIELDYDNPKLKEVKEFSIGPVKLRTAPEFIKEEDVGKYLSYTQKELLKNAKFVLSIEYEANALGDQDKEWKGDTKRGKQKTAYEKIRIACLSLWLAKPSPLRYDFVLHIKDCDKSPFTVQSFSVPAIIPHFRYENEFHDQVDIEIAEKIYNSIANLERKGPVWMAIRTTFDALTSPWEIRYVLLWIVLEALFGTNIEIKYRLSQRLSFFLSSSRNEAAEICKKVKKGYDWRSKIVHGMRLDKLDRGVSEKILYNSEFFVRDALVKIFMDDELMDLFSNDENILPPNSSP